MLDPHTTPALTAEAWLALGQACHRQWDIEETLKAFTKAIASNPDFVEAYIARAKAYRDFSYTEPTYREKSVADYSSAIALQPTHAKLYHDRALAYAELGSYHSRQGDEHSAITAFTLALVDCDTARQLDSRLIPVLQQIQIMVYNGRGLSQRAIGQFEAAMSDFDLGLALEPNNFMLLTNRGGTHNNSGNYVQALFEFDKVLGQSPDLLIINMMRGNTRLNQGDYRGAIDDFTTSRPELQEPELAMEIYSRRANAYLHLPDYDRAIADFDKALQLNPQNIDAMYGRGYAYFQKNELDKAAHDMDAVLRIDPNHTAAQAALAEINQVRGF